jgi:hypothetical protein
MQYARTLGCWSEMVAVHASHLGTFDAAPWAYYILFAALYLSKIRPSALPFLLFFLILLVSDRETSRMRPRYALCSVLSAGSIVIYVCFIHSAALVLLLLFRVSLISSSTSAAYCMYFLAYRLDVSC